jgi:hypothetical protein
VHALNQQRAWPSNDSQPFRAGSNGAPVHGIAQPALHQLAIRKLDGQRRLEPRHAAGESEVMEWRRAALASLTQELARSAHAEAPLDSARNSSRRPTR